jgi:hypothetical protein
MSNSTKGPCEFMMYSFDVRIEGKNVCRLGDPLFHNKKNTMGYGGRPAPATRGAAAAAAPRHPAYRGEGVRPGSGWDRRPGVPFRRRCPSLYCIPG